VAVPSLRSVGLGQHPVLAGQLYTVVAIFATMIVFGRVLQGQVFQ
jgi:hypothetical protein